MKQRVTKKQKQAAEELARIEAQLKAVKPLYKRREELTMQLVHDGILSVNLSEYCLCIVDNFAEKNTAFKVASVQRYEARLEKRGRL